MYTETHARVIPVDGTPLATLPGQSIVVAILDDYDRACEVVAALGSEPEKPARGKR